MTRLSTKCRYGLRALVEVARAFGGEPLKRRDIARRQDISEGYLENLFVLLKSGGILFATRGARGGYALARPPGEISLLEVVKILEGPLGPVECLNNEDYCDRREGCTTRKVWERIRRSTEKILSEMTLEDLVKQDEPVLAGN